MKKFVSIHNISWERGHLARLIMIATYRETKDYEKMMKLTRKVPVAELQRYFSVSGKI